MIRTRSIVAPPGPATSPARARVRGAAAGRPGERGAALLVVLVTVAVVTALAAELAYDTQVSLRIAANARDELRATYLAKSGVALSRLVLSLQQDVDAAMGQVQGMQPGMPRLQVTQVVPVGSALAANLFREPPPAAPPAAAPGGEGARAGPAPGGFEARVEDEGRKVNVQLDAGWSSGVLAAQIQALWQLICDPRWDALFDREDENGVRVSRQELPVYLRDWVDDDSTGSVLAAAFPPGGCLIIPALNPFEQGFADENFAYDRGEDRYRAKNARMDSLGELYLVAGVTDAFMAAFGDEITVYLPREAQLNVNELDRARLLYRAWIIADPPGQPALLDPEFAVQLQKLVAERTYGGVFSITPRDFADIVKALGVKVDENMIAKTSTKNPLTDTSRAFRMTSSGRAGDVTRKLEVVVWLDKVQPGAPAAAPGAGALGRIVHWRED